MLEFEGSKRGFLVDRRSKGSHQLLQVQGWSSLTQHFPVYLLFLFASDRPLDVASSVLFFWVVLFDGGEEN